MPLNKLICDGDNQDLTNERLKSSFDTDLLAAELRGGAEKLARVRQLRDEITARAHLFHVDKPSAHQTRVEKLEDVSRLTKHMWEVLPEIADVTSNSDMITVLRDVIGIEGFPLAIHSLMFVPTIQNQADDEQRELWLMDAMLGKIIGTYAQTELGHGTNLSAIETTATFDIDHDEFVIHTPTTTANKWWPGGLGSCCTHVVLVANLVIGDKNHGPHPFFMQIRDVDTYEPMNRVRVGDIGTKMGINCVDNGYLGFEHYRIPRRNMLMKHSKVSRDGVYTPAAHPKLGYTTMLYMRSEMIYHQSQYLAMALVIAIRYSAVRRQGEIRPGQGVETQIIDYQTQQYRLLPGLARCIAFITAAETVRNMTEQCLAGLAHGNAEHLADLHNLSCGLKAVVTNQSSQSIDQARQACGGHGYSDASYLPALFTSAIGACTYEGENIVMLLQLAKYLMKTMTRIEEGSGEQLGVIMQYLVKKRDTSGADKTQILLAHFEHIARQRVNHAYRQMRQLESSGVDKDVAFSQCSVDMAKAARAHTKLFLAAGFAQRCERDTVADVACRRVFNNLLALYLNFELSEMASDLSFDGYLSGDEVLALRSDVYDAMSRLRPDAVSIVDSFDICDRELRSVLGRRDGHVYENLVKWAQMSPLNQKGLPHVEKYLKPMTQSKL